MVREHRFSCPYCGAGISMLLDLSAPDQFYIEDCEVCCRPINVSFRVEDETVVEFDAGSDD